MKAKLHVTSLNDVGGEIEVTAQGRGRKDAVWRPMQAWKFRVPDHVAGRWRIGTELQIQVKAK